jgi:hypothetical protein
MKPQSLPHTWIMSHNFLCEKTTSFHSAKFYISHHQVCTCLIPAKNQSWTQDQDQACRKVFKSTQYQDDLIYSKVNTRPTLVHIVSRQTLSLGQIWCTQSLLTSILPPNLLFSPFEQHALDPHEEMKSAVYNKVHGLLGFMNLCP